MDWVRAARYLSFTTAALLLLAAVWYAIYTFGVTTPAAPSLDSSLPRSENLRAFFAYQRSVAWQEYGFTLVAALAFLLVAPIGVVLHELLARHRPSAAIASVLFSVAASLLVAGQLVQVGARRAVLSASRSELADPEALNLVWDLGLVISNWLENGGYFSLALGIVGWVMAARQIEPVPRAWIALSYVLSVALLGVVLFQALEIWAVYDILLALSGAVLAPTWFLLTARVCTSAARA